MQNPCTGSATQKCSWPDRERVLCDFQQHTGQLIDCRHNLRGISGSRLHPRGSAPRASNAAATNLLRGVDNAVSKSRRRLEIATGLTWWKDGGGKPDVASILRSCAPGAGVRPSRRRRIRNPSQPGWYGRMPALLRPMPRTSIWKALPKKLA